MLKKLKRKSPKEIVFRATKLIGKKIETRLYNGKSNDISLHRILVSAAPQKSSFANTRPQFFFNETREKSQKFFLENFPEEYKESLERADQFLRHKFKFLGISFEYQDRILWNRDPVTRRDFNKLFYQKVNIFKDDGKTDIKHVWEVNRHQFFIDLAKAYFLTRDEKYAQKFVELFNDWIAENPYKYGVNWTSSLEIAVRSYSWIWSLYFLLDSPLIDDMFLEEFLKNIYLHGKYLSENLSFYFSPYNHLIGEASALFFIGYLFPELKTARGWKKKGWKILETEISKQFYYDGICVEQATFYHYFTFGFYLMPIILKLQNNENVPQEILDQIHRIFEFSMYLTKPDGTTPYIGDIDNARSIYFNNPEHWDFRNFLSIGAVLFNSGELKFSSLKMWEDVLWLFGTKGVETYSTISSKEPEEKAGSFTRSGYFIGRSGWGKEDHYFWFDFGPLAHGVHTDDTPSAAHGHADILNFELTASGKNFIIDPGFSNYRGDFAWHSYFRSTPAHNCVVVDGVGLARQEGIIQWSNVAEPEVYKIVIQDKLVFCRASHNAFNKLPGNPKHYRNFLFINGEIWLILDEFAGTGEHMIESYLHFAAECKCQRKNDALCLTNEGACLNICFVDNGMDMEIERGGARPNQGWISSLYRLPEPAPVLRRSTKRRVPFWDAFVLIPGKEELFKFKKDAHHTLFVRTKKSTYHFRFPVLDVPEFSSIKTKPMRIFELEWEDGKNRMGLRYSRFAKKELELCKYQIFSNQQEKLIWKDDFNGYSGY